MKKLLITGGSQGIGKATVEEFTSHGYEVYAPTIDEMNLLYANEIDSYIEKHKDICFDVIVNNAGINDLNLVEDFTDEEIHRMLMINLEAPIRLLRAFVPAMKKNNYGRIVNIGSIWGVVSKPKRLLYCATKHGIHGVTNTLALELAPYGIMVNTVCPGFTLTELTRKNNSPSEIENISNMIPAKRMAQPNEIAKAVYYFGSQDNTYITGQQICVDGGYSVQ